MGAPSRDYERKLPPNSYIHVEDFQSPKQLATYLQMVSEREQLYKKYFEWKKKYTLIPIREQYYCRMCAMLHAGGPQIWYKDLNDWYRNPELCIKPSKENPYGFWRIEEQRYGMKSVRSSMNALEIQ